MVFHDSNTAAVMFLLIAIFASLFLTNILFAILYIIIKIIAKKTPLNLLYLYLCINISGVIGVGIIFYQSFILGHHGKAYLIEYKYIYVITVILSTVLSLYYLSKTKKQKKE